MVGSLRSSKCSKATWNWSEQPFELTQKIVREAAALHSWHCCDVTIFAHYYACNYWNSLMFGLTHTNCSHLKVTAQRQPAFHPCHSYFINNLNMTASNVEKHSFVVLNVKLQVTLGKIP